MPDEIQLFEVGEKVYKSEGYTYPGVVVAAFQTTEKKWRYVVECTEPAVKGMLHIFNGKQLKSDIPF